MYKIVFVAGVLNLCKNNNNRCGCAADNLQAPVINGRLQIMRGGCMIDIFSVFTLIGGLAFFLYGMSQMSQGLEKIAGGKLEQLLKKMTSNPLKSFAFGAFITAVIQSSSALTVMLVGLVNSGIMKLSQTVSVIIGANVGTTITAWVLSLTAIQDKAGLFFKFLKPESFSPLFAFVGVIMIMASKSNKRKSAGSVLIGFAILMTGMMFMSESMAPLSDVPQFKNMMTAFSNPVLGMIAGLVVTMIIQSSSASVGILQALSLSGSVTWAAAIPIILGQNLGTCVSALLASIGVNINAKRVAGVHVIFNILGVCIFISVLLFMQTVLKPEFLSTDINPFGIAVFHTIFNVSAAIILLPFSRFIEKLAVKFISENKSEANETVFLDERLLLSPTLAISECFKKTLEMGDVSKYNFINASKMLKTFRPRMAEEIEKNEIKLDSYEDKLGAFLVKVSSKNLSVKEGNKVSQLLLTIGEFERIGDHACGILKVAQKFNDSESKLSQEAVDELKIIVSAVEKIFDMAFDVYKTDDLSLAKKIEPLDAVIKKDVRRAKNNHVQRLKAGLCSIDTGFLFSDLLTDLRRISAHCSNISMSVIQLHNAKFAKHKYSHRNKEEDTDFNLEYKDYKSKYGVNKNYKV